MINKRLKQNYMKVLLNIFHLNGHTLGFYPQTLARRWLHVHLFFIPLGALDEVNEAVKGVEDSIRKLVRLFSFFFMDETRC